MAQVVDGRQLAAEVRAEIRERIEKLGQGMPRLAAVRVGEDPGSKIYVRNKRRACADTGLDSVELHLSADLSEDELLEQVQRLNEDPAVHGILVQLPLPDAISAARVAATIRPEKDVDGLHPQNAGKLLAAQPALYPCTPLGCLEILDRHGIQIEGSRAVVLGRSEIVGKPVALLLLHRHATVTLCHSRTHDLPSVVREADILIAAVGRPRMVQGDWLKPGSSVIDVGINRVDGKLVGDVDFDAALARVELITPVPGGVGPLTIAMLLRNTLQAFQSQTRLGGA